MCALSALNEDQLHRSCRWDTGAFVNMTQFLLKAVFFSLSSKSEFLHYAIKQNMHRIVNFSSVVCVIPCSSQKTNTQFSVWCLQKWICFRGNRSHHQQVWASSSSPCKFLPTLPGKVPYWQTWNTSSPIAWRYRKKHKPFITVFWVVFSLWSLQFSVFTCQCIQRLERIMFIGI